MTFVSNKVFVYSIRAICWSYVILGIILNLFNPPIIFSIISIIGLNYKRTLYPYNPTFEKIAMGVLILMLLFSMAGFRL